MHLLKSSGHFRHCRPYSSEQELDQKQQAISVCVLSRYVTHRHTDVLASTSIHKYVYAHSFEYFSACIDT